MNTVTVNETELIYLKESVLKLQNEIDDLRQNYLGLINRLSSQTNENQNLSDELIKESEHRLREIEKGNIKIYDWKSIAGKYGLVV